MTKCVSACSFLPTLLPSHREGGQRVNSIQGNGLRLFSSLLFLLTSVPHAFFTEGWCVFHRQHSTAWWCWLWRVRSLGYKTHIFQVIMGYVYIYFFFPRDFQQAVNQALPRRTVSSQEWGWGIQISRFHWHCSDCVGLYQRSS